MKIDLITNKESIKDGINPNDEFYTPIYAITPLLKYLKPNSNILCPFDTEQSYFVKILKENGHNVTYGHITTGQDFFKIEIPDNIDYIISNPPYSLKFEVFQKLFETGIPFAMLVGVVGLFESQKRFNLFKDNQFEVMYFNKRICYFKDYEDKVEKLKPPFSSVYLTKGILPSTIVFETIEK
jgi:hypothetical protein